MIGCKCAIYQKGIFCLEPLADRGANSQEQFTRARSRNWPTHRLTKFAHNCSTDLTNNCLDNQERLRKRANSHEQFTRKSWDQERSSDRPNNRPRTIKQLKAKWINNWDKRLGKAKRNRTSNQTINQTNNWEQLFGKVKNNWSNKHKSDYNYR